MSGFTAACFSSIQSAHLDFPSQSSYSVSYSLFKSCSSSGSGGAILINYASLRSSIAQCAFQNNTSGDRGGAICILDVASADVGYCCFLYNYAPYSPNTALLSHVSSLLTATYNWTCEAEPLQAYHGTCLGATTTFFSTNNNFTGTKALTYAGGVLMLTMPNTTVMTFSMLAGGAGCGVWSMETRASPTISSCNSVNNSITNGYGLVFMTINIGVTFSNCVFIENNCTMPKFSNGGTLTINGCFFDFSFSSESFASVTYSGCIFGAGRNNLISMRKINMEVCHALCPSDSNPFSIRAFRPIQINAIILAEAELLST